MKSQFVQILLPKKTPQKKKNKTTHNKIPPTTKEKTAQKTTHNKKN